MGAEAEAGDSSGSSMGISGLGFYCILQEGEVGNHLWRNGQERVSSKVRRWGGGSKFGRAAMADVSLDPLYKEDLDEDLFRPRMQASQC
jgi:hypothetical protein